MIERWKLYGYKDVQLFNLAVYLICSVIIIIELLKICVCGIMLVLRMIQGTVQVLGSLTLVPVLENGMIAIN